MENLFLICYSLLSHIYSKWSDKLFSLEAAPTPVSPVPSYIHIIYQITTRVTWPRTNLPPLDLLTVPLYQLCYLKKSVLFNLCKVHAVFVCHITIIETQADVLYFSV